MYKGQPAGNGTGNIGILPPSSRMLCRCDRGSGCSIANRVVMLMRDWLSGKTEEEKVKSLSQEGGKLK